MFYVDTRFRAVLSEDSVVAVIDSLILFLKLNETWRGCNMIIYNLIVQYIETNFF